jgi:hypothetical protein
MEKANSLIPIMLLYSAASEVSSKYNQLTQMSPSPLTLTILGSNQQRSGETSQYELTAFLAKF